ncbi:MAG: iron ABC transporter ATP-binding protein [Patescibacteria group bacterium]|nr:MAG: iron ABC transporter ATP-binding protein [Patescibacteria group bacterium]
MQNISRILSLAKPLYYLIVALALLILLGAGLSLVVPLFSKAIVDQISLQLESGAGDTTTLGWLLGGMFLVGVLGAILGSITERLGDHFAGRLRQFLTETFYKHVLTLPQSYFDSEISGKIVNQLNRGITSIQNFVNTATNFILPSFLQSFFTLSLMAYYSWQVALMVFALFPLYLFISWYSAKKWGTFEEKKNALEDQNRGRITEVIGNIKLVKSFNAQSREYELVKSNMIEINKYYAKQSTLFHIFDFARNVSLVLVLLGVYIFVFYATFNGAMTLGVMVLILQLVEQARRPLFAMSFILTQVQQAEQGSKEYFGILDLEAREPLVGQFEVPEVVNAQIDFENVRFEYESGRAALTNVNLSLGPRETVALVGHSGAGKTTIVNLILKFYEATEGEIRLNGQRYAELDARAIRGNIALVFQESELFSSTIRENIAYGKIDATDEEIFEALKKAYAYDFVSKLPKGLDSTIGERGVKLSGGQRQRIQIARAILKNAPILILDEATSALDAESEIAVQNAMENLVKDRLVIMIAHRFSTIQNAHKVVVIDEGKIVDCGAPAELAARPGIYADLLKYQIEGNKKLLAGFELY